MNLITEKEIYWAIFLTKEEEGIEVRIKITISDFELVNNFSSKNQATSFTKTQKVKSKLGSNPKFLWQMVNSKQKVLLLVLAQAKEHSGLFI